LKKIYNGIIWRIFIYELIKKNFDEIFLLEAIENLKQGKKVTRNGWNEKGAWVVLRNFSPKNSL